MSESVKKIRAGILGASGYTGAELVRLLARHPHVEIVLLTADRKAGQPIAEVFSPPGDDGPAGPDGGRRGGMAGA